MYNKNSSAAVQGKSGEDRAEKLIKKYLKERKSKILVSKGSKNPVVNGKLGDILLHLVDEAPLIGIEIKTASSNYPDSISISKFEMENSRAKWLMAFNVDKKLGCWVQKMEIIKEHAVKKRGRVKEDVYFVSNPPVENRVSLNVMFDEIQVLFGE